MKRRIRTYSGVKTPEVTARETKHRIIARKAAAEGIVLLKNEGVLPIKKSQKISLYGPGVFHFIKGGTGSGDVNEREVVSIQEGLDAQGVQIVNREAALAANRIYDQAKKAWAEEILPLMEAAVTSSNMGHLQVMEEHPFQEPLVNPIRIDDVMQSDTVFYVISRVSGEGRDRREEAGDYYLDNREKEELEFLSKNAKQLAVILNTGGPISVKEILAFPNVKALISVSQPGMEAGNSIADVLTGAVTPSGKLTDTWANYFREYPNAETFSYRDGNPYLEKYEEGIYVGYRYFDSFQIKPQFAFGFGLSYTSFEMETVQVSCSEDTVEVTVKVTNTGSEYAGKEVVQVYAGLPQGKIKKEQKRLVGFVKTKSLAPGESQVVEIEIPAKQFASYYEERAAWMVESGNYYLLIGNSSDQVRVEAILEVEEDAVIERVTNICPLQMELTQIQPSDAMIGKQIDRWKYESNEKNLVPVLFAPAEQKKNPIPKNELDEKAWEIASQLNEDEMIAMLMGEITKGQDNLKENALVETGIYVPGAAGETSCMLEEKYDVPGISMADGPAGLRLMRSYEVDLATGKIYSQSVMSALEGGLFAREYQHENSERYYQYATAIPIGTMLAQTWNREIVERVGQMVGQEMVEFGIAWWLAPGMNIHRNPLGGRNFEYYSEDPFLSGVIAASITKGVQSNPGVGTVIKHFACNNQEDQRLFSDSVVSERTLREIYLRGFEIAVKESQPMGIMNSYNLINGIHSDNTYDLNITVARDEWDFQGIIMTDWTSTTNGSCAYMCAMSGNDLIMPGHPKDVENMKQAFASGTMDPQKAREACARLLKVIFQTIGMEQ